MKKKATNPSDTDMPTYDSVSVALQFRQGILNHWTYFFGANSAIVGWCMTIDTPPPVGLALLGLVGYISLCIFWGVSMIQAYTLRNSDHRKIKMEFENWRKDPFLAELLVRKKVRSKAFAMTLYAASALGVVVIVLYSQFRVELGDCVPAFFR